MDKAKSPKVSVIIPTYNRASLIPRAIESVLAQNYNGIEIIIVDDGSTDNTKEVINKLKDKKIKYIQHKENMGGAAARNTGIKMAKAEYIAFLDSDDEWFPKKLETQIKVFNDMNDDTGVVYSAFWKIHEGCKSYKPNKIIKKKEGWIHEELLNGNFVTLQAALLKKDCFSKAGLFDVSIQRLHDWELWLRISRYFKFKFIDEPLVNVYYTPISISTNHNALIESSKKILRKHFSEFSKNKKILSKRYFYIGKFMAEAHDTKNGKKYFKKAIKANPLNMQAYLLFLNSLLGGKLYTSNYRILKFLKSKVRNIQ
ncbi:MAG: glycosyltransferase [Actinomycetia bacterium]|nr:glycosyltransferase [Actinomycetes bacterium]